MAAVEGNSLDISQLEKTGIDNAESIVALTTSDKVNLFVCRLAKIDFDLKDVLPVVNERKEGIDIDAVSKLDLKIGFGKPLSLFEINAKISHKDYVVISISIKKDSEIEELYNLFSKDHIVPLIYKKDQANHAMIYRSGMKLNKGGEIIIVDFDPTSTDFEFIEDNEKEGYRYLSILRLV